MDNLTTLEPLNSAKGGIKSMIMVVSQHVFVDGEPKEEFANFLDLFRENCSDINFLFVIPNDVDIPEGFLASNSKLIDFRLEEHTNEKGVLSRDSLLYVDLDFKKIRNQMQTSGGNCASSETTTVEDFWTPTDWIQDQFFVLNDSEGSPVLIDPYYIWVNMNFLFSQESKDRAFAEIVNSFLPSIISSNSGILLRANRFFFQGGDVIGGEKMVFVGQEIVKRNLDYYFPNVLQNGENWRKDFDEFWNQLKKSFHADYLICPGLSVAENGVSFLKLPTGLQHLDQFFVYAETDIENEAGRKVLVGEMYEWKDEMWVKKAERRSTRQYFLNQIADWLKNQVVHGFEYPFQFNVERIPICEVNDYTRMYSPNCHLHTENEETIAFVGKFASSWNARNQKYKAADQLVKAAFEKTGIRVVPVSGGILSGSTTQNSGLHCLTKVLMRE